MITARLATMISGAGSAIGGIRIAESMESGAYAHLGRIPTSSYSGYVWTSLAGGGGGGVPSGVAVGNWVRIIRKGNSITGYRATDSGGSPGAWSQVGQPQTIIMTTPVFVGFFVNNASGVGLNTCTFTGLSIVPLNKAPIITATTPASFVTTSATVSGVVTDDNFPAPPGVTTLWSTAAGPATALFANPNLPNTTASLTADGSYVLRLSASDGSVQTFDDVSLVGHVSGFAQWQLANFTGGSTNPNQHSPSAIVHDVETVDPNRYLRLTVTKSPSATDVIYAVQATGNHASPGSWSSNGLVIEENTSTTLRVRDNVPVSNGQPRFMRVKITEL